MSERTVRVLAVEQGFYGGSRRRAGTEFDMLEKDLERVPAEPGADDVWIYKYPSWVRSATNLNRRVYEKQQKDAQEKAMRAAIVSSGGAGAKAKKQAYEDALNAGRGPQTAVK